MMTVLNRETLHATLLTLLACVLLTPPANAEQGPANPSAQETVRSDIHISGIYPHLTAYGVYSQHGAHHMPGHEECGIGAVVPWANKLWMVN